MEILIVFITEVLFFHANHVICCQFIFTIKLLRENIDRVKFYLMWLFTYKIYVSSSFRILLTIITFFK